MCKQPLLKVLVVVIFSCRYSVILVGSFTEMLDIIALLFAALLSTAVLFTAVLSTAVLFATLLFSAQKD